MCVSYYMKFQNRVGRCFLIFFFTVDVICYRLLINHNPKICRLIFSSDTYHETLNKH